MIIYLYIQYYIIIAQSLTFDRNFPFKVPLGVFGNLCHNMQFWGINESLSTKGYGV